MIFYLPLDYIQQYFLCDLPDLTFYHHRHIEGTWGSWESCPPDSHVIRYKIKHHDGGTDLMSTTGVTLTCSDDLGTELKSAEMASWGQWLPESDLCYKGFSKVKMRVERSQEAVSVLANGSLGLMES